MDRNSLSLVNSQPPCSTEKRCWDQMKRRALLVSCSRAHQKPGMGGDGDMPTGHRFHRSHRVFWPSLNSFINSAERSTPHKLRKDSCSQKLAHQYPVSIVQNFVSTDGNANHGAHKTAFNLQLVPSKTNRISSLLVHQKRSSMIQPFLLRCSPSF